MTSHSEVDWVVFDLGETLVDETRVWTAWAEHLGVPPFTFFALIGAVIADRRPHTDVFELLRPGFDLPAEIRAKDDAGLGWTLSAADLYHDALPALISLQEQGYRLAVMANQPRVVEPFLATLPVDLWATSAAWGVNKPDPMFFDRVSREVGSPPERIAYVGDRVDNDVLPAIAAGLTAIHVRRGPWGHIQRAWPEAATASALVDRLDELPAVLATLGAR